MTEIIFTGVPLWQWTLGLGLVGIGWDWVWYDVEANYLDDLEAVKE